MLQTQHFVRLYETRKVDGRSVYLFLVAVLIFGLCQGLFWCSLPLFNPGVMDYAKRFDFDGTVHGIKNLQACPKVIFLGTSLLRYSFFSLDGQTSKNPKAAMDRHVWQTAPAVLQKNYSFAIAGILISDFNLIFRRFVTGDIASGTVYIECSPRAFYDSGLEASKTPAFSYFCGWQELLSSNLTLADNSQRFLWLVNLLVPMYRFRQDIQETVAHPLNSFQRRFEAVKQSNQNEVALAASSNSFEKSLQKSVADYAQRYAGISLPACSAQFYELEDLIHQIQNKRAKPILIVMPLTQNNIDLLPKGFFQNWKNSITQLARGEHCLVLDLSDCGFEITDFRDSVHLNTTGAAKLAKILEISAESKSAKWIWLCCWWRALVIKTMRPSSNGLWQYLLYLTCKNAVPAVVYC